MERAAKVGVQGLQTKMTTDLKECYAEIRWFDQSSGKITVIF